MAEPMTEENASSWYDDTPITDEQYASVWDSAMAVQERPSYSRHVVRKLLAEIDRLRTEAAYMREQIEQQAQVIEERKTQTVAYRALAEEHQKRGDKLSAQLTEIGDEWSYETRSSWGDWRRCTTPMTEEYARKRAALSDRNRLVHRKASEWREVPNA